MSFFPAISCFMTHRDKAVIVLTTLSKFNRFEILEYARKTKLKTCSWQESPWYISQSTTNTINSICINHRYCWNALEYHIKADSKLNLTLTTLIEEHTILMNNTNFMRSHIKYTVIVSSITKHRFQTCMMMFHFHGVKNNHEHKHQRGYCLSYIMEWCWDIA